MTLKSKKGRKKTIEDPKLRSRNLDIFRERFYERKSINELMEEYKLSRKQIYRTLNFVSKDLGTIPEQTKIEGSLFEIRERIKDLMKLRKRELKKKEPSIRSVCELETQIRADGEIELKLEGLLKEAVEVEVNSKQGSIVAILKEITKEKE